ncbi:hypothetical protein AMR42_12165 [Limnothrix sp. PR1529]|uniref:hypothetical protein n=1 Tax=Limnothrix sp. PR1529 TaxID=1704291 RepID=UPI00081D5FDA|nr:hypothetical protein [Limnothrix sp. PR1529]OCQ94865.1 hypothetical protein BCR12_14790 [Limnothrix sp. P13C2]PIB09843.1 hypothetical protein AMR42_12165 [Limnothrix sp. PR1529]
MALPANFSSTEHLQDLVKRFANREVNDWFRDVDDETNLQAPRASLKLGCLHQEQDSIQQTNLRMFLFWMVVTGEQRFGSKVYGIPIQEEQARVKFKPQIMLYFEQPWEEREVVGTERMSPVTGEISVRLRNQEWNTISESELKTLGQLIKSNFGGSSPKRWQKGKHYFSYYDKEKGHQFKILVRNRSDGRDLVGDVLNLIGETPNWDFAAWKESEDPASAFPDSSRSGNVLGKVKRLPRSRPNATVVFRYAIAHVWGEPLPIPLYDLSGRFRGALVR